MKLLVIDEVERVGIAIGQFSDGKKTAVIVPDRRKALGLHGPVFGPLQRLIIVGELCPAVAGEIIERHRINEAATGTALGR
ncbi:hypothetical protein D3C87_1730360 [compost metagenome]